PGVRLAPAGIHPGAAQRRPDPGRQPVARPPRRARRLTPSRAVNHRQGEPMNAVDRLWSHAETTPDAIAVRVGDQAWTYGHIRDLVTAWAQRLRDAGIERGDRVLLVAPTSQEFVVVHHAIL